MPFDFNSFLGKYKNLDASGVGLLSDFFSDVEVQKLINTIESHRKKKMMMTGGVFALLLLLALILMPSGEDKASFLIVIVFGSIFLVPFVFFIINGVSSFFWKESVKETLLPLFVKKIEPQMLFKKTPQDVSWNLEFLDGCIEKGILSSYMRLDRFEDTIAYDITNNSSKKTIELKAIEVKTSRQSGGKKKHRYTNNHAYIMRVKFLDPKFTLKHVIQLKQDFNDKPFLKLILGLVLTLAIAFFMMIFLSPTTIVDGQSQADIGAYLASLTSGDMILWLVSMVGVFTAIFFITGYISGMNRVRMENLEFEKRFDVYCENPDEARKLLTPSFMYRILDYIDKIDARRVYTFYFKDDYFYIKYDLKASSKASHMEVSSLRSISKSLDDYVKFYLEIKAIKSLIEDLKLFYYDTGTFNSQIVK